MVHPPAVHIVGEVVERVKADRPGLLDRAGDRLEGLAVQHLVPELVDQIEVGAADPLERRQAELGFGPRRAALDGELQRLFGIEHAEAHRARRRAVGGAELGGMARRLPVEEEVDVALGVMIDRLGAVGADMGEAQAPEQPGHRLRIGAGELDEGESVEAERVFVGGHGGASQARFVRVGALLPAGADSGGQMTVARGRGEPPTSEGSRSP